MVGLDVVAFERENMEGADEWFYLFSRQRQVR